MGFEGCEFKVRDGDASFRVPGRDEGGLNVWREFEKIFGSASEAPPAKPAHAAHAALARVRGTYVMGVISRDELLESCRSCAEGVDNGEEIRNCVPDASREAHPVLVRFTEGVLEEGEKPAGSR